MVKYIIVIVSLFAAIPECVSQNPVLSLGEHPRIRAVDGSYYKDMHDVLNDFEGTWLYETSDRSLKIVLEKEEQFFNSKFYTDFLFGEFEYKENGVSIMNTLSNLNNPFIRANRHKIQGGNIYKTCKFAPVDDCEEGEKRVGVRLMDINENRVYYLMTMHKRMINGQEALKVIFGSTPRSGTLGEGETSPVPTIHLDRELIFYKQ